MDFSKRKGAGRTFLDAVHVTQQHGGAKGLLMPVIQAQAAKKKGWT